MPTLSDVVDLVHGWYPPDTADERDAVGLVHGDPDAEVAKVLFAVDPTIEVAREAAEWGADLLVVHHPLFLRGVHGFAETTPKGRTLATLVRAGCALLTAHTNADRADPGVSDALAGALGPDRPPTLRSQRRSARQAHGLRAARPTPTGSGRRWPRREPDGSASTRRRRSARRGRAGSGPWREPTPRSARSASWRWSARSGSRWCSTAALRGRGRRGDAGRPPLRGRPPGTSSRSPTLARRPPARAGSATSSRRPSARSPQHVARALPQTARGVLVAGDPERAVRRVAVAGGAGDFLLGRRARSGRRRLRDQRPAPPPGDGVRREGRPGAGRRLALGGRVDLAAAGGGPAGGGPGIRWRPASARCAPTPGPRA